MLKLEDCTIANGEFTLEADLEIAKGERVAVMGPSGAGKTTLLEAIAGFRDLVRGRITVEGREIGALPPGRRPVAMLFQDGNLFPHLSATQNVALGIRPNGRLSAEEEAEVESALDWVGLSGLGARRPAALSGGQQSRVALARVMVQRRDLLLLDEPFAALGPALKAEMLDRVAELVAQTGTTLLMISHDPDDARRIASQVLAVAEGAAHAPVPTAEFFENTPQALREYLGP